MFFVIIMRWFNLIHKCSISKAPFHRWWWKYSP